MAALVKGKNLKKHKKSLGIFLVFYAALLTSNIESHSKCSVRENSCNECVSSRYVQNMKIYDAVVLRNLRPNGAIPRSPASCR